MAIYHPVAPIASPALTCLAIMYSHGRTLLQCVRVCDNDICLSPPAKRRVRTALITMRFGCRADGRLCVCFAPCRGHACIGLCTCYCTATAPQGCRVCCVSALMTHSLLFSCLVRWLACWTSTTAKRTRRELPRFVEPIHMHVFLCMRGARGVSVHFPACCGSCKIGLSFFFFFRLDFHQHVL